MYCPKCGREMEHNNGQFRCMHGQMGLSGYMQARLTERFPVHHPRAAEIDVGARLLRWYCPGCGIPLDENMKCSSCGNDIKDLHYQLVQVHPHRKGEGVDPLEISLSRELIAEIIPPGTVWSGEDVEHMIARASAEIMDAAKKQGVLDEILRRQKQAGKSTSDGGPPARRDLP